jgi:ELWxxDGT repeat protein
MRSWRSLWALFSLLASAPLAWSQTPYLVGDLDPGAPTSLPRGFTAVGDRMFFLARGPAVGMELWSSPGGPGSATVLDLTPGPASLAKIPAFALDGALFFDSESTEGNVLWRTDGTPGGTSFISNSGATGAAAVRGGIAVFNGALNRAYRTDGTPHGTYRIAAPLGEGDVGTKELSPFFVPFRDGFAVPWFTSDPYQVVLTDATGSTSSRLTDETVRCTAGRPVGELLFMSCSLSASLQRNLWVTDGTFSGLRLVKELPSSISAMKELDGRLYFQMPTGGVSVVWRSDGTEAGTVPLASIAPTLEQGDLAGATASGGVLYFRGFTAATGWEPWRTDGTAAGTFMLGDLAPGIGSSALVAQFAMVSAGGTVVFPAETPDRGAEMWRSDGTPGGTIPLPEILPGPASSSPRELTPVGARVFFSADDGVHGREPWAVDLATRAVAVADTFVTEGDSGFATATFRVRLDAGSTGAVTVAYATEPGSAQAGDFVATSGQLTFAPGELEHTVAVPVVGDLADETDESFVLRLSSVAGASLAQPRAVAVVLDDDAPRIQVAGSSVIEGNAGFTDAAFGFTLTTKDGGNSGAAVVVRFVTAAGTATAQDDFAAIQGIVTFPPGSASGTTRTALVPVEGDTLDEPDETFALRLDGQNDAEVPAVSAPAVIRDDDGIDAAPPVELSHGVALRATLAPPPGRTQDRDFYVLQQHPGASYELVIDEVSGDAVPLQVRRFQNNDTRVSQPAEPVGVGGSLSLRWQSTITAPSSHEYVRVEGPACGTTCGADDVYRIRFYETTLAAPRVNTLAGQASVVVLTNVSARPIAGTVHLRRAGGDNAGQLRFQLDPHQSFVSDISTVVPPFSGSLLVSHDGSYGALAGKVVALDPLTGLSFDTPLTPRPR